VKNIYLIGKHVNNTKKWSESDILVSFWTSGSTAAFTRTLA